jgi:hypothetical protein
VPLRELFSGKFNVAYESGNPLVAMGTLAGATALAAAGVRLLLVGLAHQSTPVRRTNKSIVPRGIATALIAGALLIAGVSAGFVSTEAAASGLLHPEPVESAAPNPAP